MIKNIFTSLLIILLTVVVSPAFAWTPVEFNSSISIKVLDTSQNSWRDYGDIFVLPTKDVEVLVNVTNTGNVTQEDFFIGVEFWKLNGSETNESFGLYVHDRMWGRIATFFNGTSNSGGSLEGVDGATCTLYNDPNGNSILDINETITVKCKAPASYWGLVEIDKGESVYIKAFETGSNVDVDGDGIRGEWWEDGISKIALLDAREQSFESGYMPEGWETKGKKELWASGDCDKWGDTGGWALSDRARYDGLYSSQARITTRCWRAWKSLLIEVNLNEESNLTFYWAFKNGRYGDESSDPRPFKSADLKFFLDNTKIKSTTGNWKKVEITIPPGTHQLKWYLSGWDCRERACYAYGYLDKVQLGPAEIDYEPIDFGAYSFTKPRDPCRYDYHVSSQSYGTEGSHYSQSEKHYSYDTKLKGVGCGGGTFYYLDSYYYRYAWKEDGEYHYNNFWKQTQEWWYGPTGYGAAGKEGAVVTSSITNTRYRCDSNELNYCSTKCDNPYSCTLYSSTPEGCSVTKQFCPYETVYSKGGGCCPPGAGIYYDGSCYDDGEYLLCDEGVRYVGPAGTWVGNCTLIAAPPVVNITSPIFGQVVYDTHFTVTGNTSGEIAKVEVSINDEPFLLATGTKPWGVQVMFEPGNNTIVAKATDVFGNINTTSVNITYIANETVPPELNVVWPHDGDEFESDSAWHPVGIYGSASDNRGVEKVEVLLNYGGYDLAYTNNNWESWSKTINLKWGGNLVKVKATDLTGNSAKEYLRLVHYKPLPEITPPTLPDIPPTDTTGAITGVTTGLFNFSSTPEELQDVLEYQKDILDGTYALAGRNVTYVEEILYGHVHSISPAPLEIINKTNSTKIVWYFPEVRKGETLNLIYNVSFSLSAAQKKNISIAGINYTDGTTDANISRGFPALSVEALNTVGLIINMSNSSYLPYDEFVLKENVVNNGNETIANLTINGTIETPGKGYITIPQIEIPSIPPLGSVTYSLNLDNSTLVAPGNYTVICNVYNDNGYLMANATTQFEVQRVLMAEISIGTDKTYYELGNSVSIFAKVKDTSPNTPLEDAEVVFTVFKDSGVVFEKTEPVPELAPQAQAYINTYFSPPGAGNYTLNATLKVLNVSIDGDGISFLVLNTSGGGGFEVRPIPDISLSETLGKEEARALKVENATIGITNNGEGTAYNVSLIVYLPAGFMSVNNTPGVYDNGTNTIIYDLGDILSGASKTITHEFLTPFIESYDPLNFSMEAKAFYVDEFGNYYYSSVEKILTVKPIPVIKSEINSSLDEVYIYNNVTITVNVTNIGYDDAVNNTAVIEIPEELQVDLSSVTGVFDNASNTITWDVTEITPNESVIFNFTAMALPISEIRNITFLFNITYFDEDSYEYFNSSNLTIKIIPIVVLAWDGDTSDGWFVDNASHNIAYVKKVNTTTDLMYELENHFYSVLWLMNMGHCEYNCTEDGGLNSTEIDRIAWWLSEESPLTREFLFSDFTLKANPKLGDIAGFKYVGSLPMGNPYKLRNLTITGNSTLTYDYVGENLTVIGWFDKIQPEYTYSTLAIGHDLLPTKKIETYPAVTLSYYNRSRVIFFAPDIGLSAYNGYNASVWLNITRRALYWSLEPLEEVASLNANKTIKPKKATGQGTHSAKVHASIDIFSSGNIPAESVMIIESFMEDFEVDSTNGNATNTSISWDLGNMSVRTSKSLTYVLLSPLVNETTSYFINTTITYLTEGGTKTIEIPSNVTIEPKGQGGGN